MAQQQVQQEAEQLASLHELGALQQEYDKNNIGCVLTCLALFHLIPLAFLVTPLIIIFKASGPWNFPFVFFALIICLFIFSRVSLVFRPIHRDRHSRRFLYTHGLVVVKCQDEQIVASEATHWREITTIWHDVHHVKSGRSSRHVHIYNFQRSDGSYFGARLDEAFASMRSPDTDTPSSQFREPVGKEIERKTLPYLWPSVISAYERGLPARFGPLTIHTGGIQHQDHFLPWDSFERFIEDNTGGRLFILPKEGLDFSALKQVWACVPPTPTSRIAYLHPLQSWATVPYAEIPNLALFLRLAESITGNSPPLENSYMTQQHVEGLDQ